MLDRKLSRTAWGGESFTGAIRQPLVFLGIWEDFLLAGHVPGFEVRTNWGGASRAESSIIRYDGNLWHVNRARFDQDLRETVRRRGGQILTYRDLNDVAFEGGYWKLQLDKTCTITAKYLVDATGRARILARRLGVRARFYDRLVALTSLLPRNKNPEFNNTMVVEATAFGWWYAAPVPQGSILAFFTDADLVPKPLKQNMRVVPANSSFAQPEGEQGWLTVGDACAAHDPLCGWGVCRAMNNGILAADAIFRFLKHSNASLLEEYRHHCRKQFQSYLKGLMQHYAYEKRWSDAPFWKRRTETITSVK